MEPQEGDIADGPNGQHMVFKGGSWHPSSADGRPLAPISRPDYGAGMVELPNGDIAHTGPRGGFEVVQRHDKNAGTGGSGIGLAGADARTRLALGLGPMVEAQRRLTEAEASGYSYNKDLLARAAEAVPLDGGFAARALGGQDYQNYDQAARTFEASVMPIMSGSAVTPSEAQRQIRANLPQAGDSTEILATKSRNRSMMINAAAQLVGQEMPFPDVGVWGDAGGQHRQDAAAIAAAPGPAGPGGHQPGDVVVTQQPLAPTDTPNSLTLQGYAYDPQRDVWSRSRQETVTPADQLVEQRRQDESGALRKVDAFGRGFVDTATFGLADEVGAGLDTVFGSSPGSQTIWNGASIGDAYRHNVDMNRGFAQSDAQDVPVSRGLGQAAGTIAAPGAIGAGKFVAEAPNLAYAMTRGAATGAAMGGAYGAGAASGGIADRAHGAMTGAMTGAIVGGALPPAARVAGAMTSAVTRPVAEGIGDLAGRFTGRPMTGEAQAVRSVLRGVNPDEMAARAETMRAHGADPTIADIGGSNVQSRVRVAATRQTPGREVAQDFAAGRRSEVQDFAAGLGQRVSPMEATPAQLDEALATYQRTASAPEFNAVRGDRITLDPNSVMALRSEEGRAAIRDAARLYGATTDHGDREIAAELNRLADRVIDHPNVEVTVGAADLIARHLAKAGGTDANRQRVFGALGRAIRDNARSQSEGYGTALDNFAQRARLGDATAIGDRFVGNRGHTGDFVQAVSGMDAPAVDIARAAARAGMDRASGTARGAPGMLDDMATGRNMGRRMDALVGPQEGASLREGAQVGRRMIDTAQNINPRAGSNTYLNAEDGNTQAVGGIVGNIARGRPLSAVGGVIDMIRSAGISDRQAETIVRLATDPSRTDEALQILRTRFPEQEARRIVSQLTPAIAGQAGAASAPQPAPVRMVGPRA